MADTDTLSMLAEPNSLFRLLGTHWTKYHPDGAAFIRDYCESFTTAALTDRKTLELASQTVDRHNIPAYLPQQAVLLTLKESERQVRTAYHFGEASLAYGQAELSFGLSRPSEYTVWDLSDSAISGIARFSDRRIEQRECLTRGIDFVFDPADHTLSFVQNPFDNPNFRVRDIYVDGVVVDREVLLYAWGVESRSEDLVYQQLGSVLGVRTPTGLARFNASAYLNAIMDSMDAGSSVRTLQSALSAFADVPFPQRTGTVEAIWQDRHGLAIATQRELLRFRAGATPLVAEGDTIQPGQAVADPVQIFEPGAEAVASLPFLALSDGYLLPSLGGPLAFPNRPVPLSTSTSEGKTKITFELGGQAADVKAFFDELHARGVAAGFTLANALDLRPNPTTEPTAAQLPATINPMELLVENVLRYHVTIVRVRPRLLGPAHLDWGYLGLLRTVMPPHTAILLQIEQTVTEEVIGPEAEDGNPSVDEEPFTLRAQAVPEEVISYTWVTESPSLSQTGTYCEPL